MTVDAPKSVELGDAFDVIVEVTNATEENQLLTSIDLDTDFLQYADLNYTTPGYSEEWDMSYIGLFSYDYYTEMVPGDSVEIIFNMTATQTGDASGDLDVCINTESDCMFGSVSTLIEGGDEGDTETDESADETTDEEVTE